MYWPPSTTLYRLRAGLNGFPSSYRGALDTNGVSQLLLTEPNDFSPIDEALTPTRHDDDPSLAYLQASRCRAGQEGVCRGAAARMRQKCRITASITLWVCMVTSG